MAYNQYSSESGVETDQDTTSQVKLQLLSLIPNKMVYNAQDKIALIFNKDLPSKGCYRVEFKGRNREKMEVKAQLVNRCTLVAMAPVYNPPEKVKVHVSHISHEGTTSIGQLSFVFLSRLDVIGSLLQDCCDPVTCMCEALGISSNDMVDFDKALTVSFKANIPPGFHLLGLRNYSIENEISDSLYPTLLHFAAAFGLYHFTKDCLTHCPGVTEATRLRNCNNQRPSDLASKGQYDNLIGLFKSFEDNGGDDIYEPMNENEAEAGASYYTTMACQKSYINLQLWHPNAQDKAQCYENMTPQAAEDETDDSGYIITTREDYQPNEEIYTDMESGAGDPHYTDVENPSQHTACDDAGYITTTTYRQPTEVVEDGDDELYMNYRDQEQDIYEPMTDDTEPIQTTGPQRRYHCTYDIPSNLPVSPMYPSERSLSMSLERRPDTLKSLKEMKAPRAPPRSLKEGRKSPPTRALSVTSKHSFISNASSSSGTSGSTVGSGFEADNELGDDSPIFESRKDLLKQIQSKVDKADSQQSEAQYEEEQEHVGGPLPVPLLDYYYKKLPAPPPPPGSAKPKASNRNRSQTAPVNQSDVDSAASLNAPSPHRRASSKDNRTRPARIPRPISDLDKVTKEKKGPRAPPRPLKEGRKSPPTRPLSVTSKHNIPMEPASKLKKPTDYTSRTIPLTIDQSGRYYDFYKDGFCLEIPPHTVSQTTEVVCKVFENYVPSPLEQFESLVSSVVQFEPTNMILGKSINFTLMHSGLTIGHDTFVKAYDEDNHEWKRITAYEHSSLKRDHWEIPCVVVQINKLTAIAVVTRVIIPVDTFEVPTSGCLIKSSVCPDVTIRFPEASVDKAIKGSMKVIPMPKYFPLKVEELTCPLLLVNGFKGISFSKYVTIQMPHPCPERYPVEQVRLMCLEDGEWSDVTDNTESFLCEEKESTIEIRVKHFSGWWVWLYGVPSSFRDIYEHLFLARQVMCFAAFKEKCQPTLCPKITVMCANITKQKDMDEKTGYGYTRLALKTVNEGMRPNATAHVKIDGGFEINVGNEQPEEVYLNYYRDAISIDEVQTKRKADTTGNLIVSFYERYSNNTLLCKLHCNEASIEAAYQAMTVASSEGTGRKLFELFRENYTLKETVCNKLDLQKSFAKVARYYQMDDDRVKWLENDGQPRDNPTDQVLEFIGTRRPDLLVTEFINCTDSIQREDVSELLRPHK